MNIMKLRRRLGLILTVAVALCFAQLPTAAATPNEQAVIKVSPDQHATTIVMAERAFAVEGKIMGQLVIERLDREWSPIVLPTAPERVIDHVPL
jgi:hypothetical protein